jgi:hypothetical protein
VAVQPPPALLVSTPIVQSTQIIGLLGANSAPVDLVDAEATAAQAFAFVPPAEKITIPASPDSNPFGF